MVALQIGGFSGHIGRGVFKFNNIVRVRVCFWTAGKHAPDTAEKMTMADFPKVIPVFFLELYNIFVSLFCVLKIL
jgi:hypothetical protein